jgi:tetratricopeptide (TPR) repeat protein
MAKKKTSSGHAQSGKRSFILNRRTKTLAIHAPSHASGREDAPGTLDAEDFLEALVEGEKMLTPTLIEDQVPISAAVAFLADAMYISLTGEMEIQNPQLRTRLIEFVLVAWEQGHFIPSDAFPYTLSDLHQEIERLSQEDGGTFLEEAAVHPKAPSPEAEHLSPYERLKADMWEIDQERDRSIRLGKQALRRKRFDLAEKHFRHAVQADMLDESEACYDLALCRLWQRDFGEAHYLFDVDQQDREGEAPLSWFLTEWCAICAASSPSAYLASILGEMDEHEDPLEYKERLFAFDYGDSPEDVFHTLLAALFAYIRGSFEECLEQLLACETVEQEIPHWIIPFWRSMAAAALGLSADAHKWLQQALAEEIPPLLLLPLRWHEHSQPVFYKEHIRPLFEALDLWTQIAERNEREQADRKERQDRVQWWMEQGALAYREHRFLEAQEYFSLAFQARLGAKEDLGDLSIARFWYALVCLHTGDLDELEEVLMEETDKTSVRRERGVLPTLLGEWYRMCHYATHSAYLASFSHGQGAREHFRDLFAGNCCPVSQTPEAQLLQAVITFVDGSFGPSLTMVLSSGISSKIDPPWLATFWLGMAQVTDSRATQAQETFHLAIAQGMPELLLLPIWWFQESVPDTFAATLQSVLAAYHLPSPQQFWNEEESLS